MPSNSKYPICDIVAGVPDATVKIGGPIMLLIKVAGTVVPSIVLRQGDKAQALTLTLLEETKDIMDPSSHNLLQRQYETLVGMRRNIKGGNVLQFRHYYRIYQFRADAVDLSDQTVTSSQYARCAQMWEEKGITEYTRYTLRRKSSTVSKLTFVTVKEDPIAQPAPEAPSSAQQDTADPESRSADVTEQRDQQDTKQKTRTHNAASASGTNPFVYPGEDAAADGDSQSNAESSYELTDSISLSESDLTSDCDQSADDVS
ncbi:uncharacterized protein C8Q71DRAFT_855790 [Rhodofomes roseus]|uniref:Uncharacterized protein n=1 Tax=Rhodofomes roseus TaxID=34475 RepID=A0ABQ8KMQ4_9APHY|nr:uncharacterized protein C8Q71DRAFT_855790 [Rhodofomes roseus]KAH9839150.1 hypothetical protein C8Q71DRAFT_855790 [Rhodofomes roseus]